MEEKSRKVKNCLTTYTSASGRISAIYIALISCFVFLSSGFVFAQTTTPEPQSSWLTQQIRYRIPDAEEVNLVWGLNGWAPVPESRYPSQTILKNSLMHTSMVHDGEYFIANVQAPAGATIDYVFQIAKSRSGAFVDIWDVNGEEKAFHSIVLNEGFTEIEASPLISNRIIEHEQVRDRSVSRTCQTEGGFIDLGEPTGVLTALWIIWAIWVVSGGERWKGRVRQAAVSFNLSRKRVIAALTTIGLSNLLFLFGTWLWITTYRTWSEGWETENLAKYFGIQFNLGSENVAASWYSSMVLLGVSLAAALSFLVDVKSNHPGAQRYLNFGWLVVAILFAALSFDELGSFHERMSLVDYLRKVGGYRPLWDLILSLSAAVIMFFMLAWGVFRVYRIPLSFSLMFLGAMFFTGVVIFESVEELLWEPAPGETNLNKPLGFTLFEEGSELFGTLCFFGAMVVYIYSMAKPISVKSSATIRRLEFSIDQSTALRYTFLLMCLLGLGFAMVEFTGFAAMEGDSGIPQNWFPSAMAAVAAILALQLLFSATKPGDIHRYMYYIFTIFTGMLSLYYGANVKGWLIMEEVASYCAGHVISGFLIVGTVFSGVLVVMQTRELWSRVGIGIWVILLSLSFAGSGRDWAAGPLEFFAFAFLLPALVAHFFRERSAETLSV